MKINQELENELLIRKIDSEKARRNAFMSMEFFFCEQVRIERETLSSKKKEKRK